MKKDVKGKRPYFKSKVRGNDNSIIDESLTIKDVVQLKLEYIAEQLDYPPHITFISEQQIMWGNSKHFSQLQPTDPVRVGLIGGYGQVKHIHGRKPTDGEYSKMVADYGFALPFPPIGLSSLIQGTFRQAEDECIDNKIPLLYAPCKGYINEKGELIDPNWNKQEPWHGGKISGYLIFKTDENSYQTVCNYVLKEAALQLQLQVERTKKTAPELRERKILSGETTKIKAEKRLVNLAPLHAIETGQVVEDWNDLLADNINNATHQISNHQ